uniref:Transducer of regulated CREB activity C-terminal domain-containing protein n=1 Tax=Amphilophus citrinellus TaxID=61819 RepID=A0A3Q0R5M2_AMPCI
MEFFPGLMSRLSPQGVPLDTSKLPLDQRLPPYLLSQSHQHQPGSHQPLSSMPGSQPSQQPPPLGQHHHQQLHRLQQPRPNSQQQLHLQNMRNQHMQSDVSAELHVIILFSLLHTSKTALRPSAGDSPTGLSKEIASALSNVPGFEMDSFSLDDQLRMDPLSLDMLEGNLMLADPAVEDSFRSDRLK